MDNSLNAQGDIVIGTKVCYHGQIFVVTQVSEYTVNLYSNGIKIDSVPKYEVTVE